VSFSADRLVENTRTLIDSVVKAKPAASKGKYVRSIYVSSTMGPGIQVDVTAIEK
jgi:large subunit ribosomal protein L1